MIYNRKHKLSIDEIKQVEIGLLNFVSTICNKYNLNYFLAYGTLIGAIRHKAFIPWDDDIDIVMPREDYDKLIGILNGMKDNGFYECLVPLQDDYFYEFVKVIDRRTETVDTKTQSKHGGVWIDIFPLDGLKKEDIFTHYSLLILNRCRSASVNIKFPHKTNGILIPLEYLFWKLCRLIGYKFFLKISLRQSKKYKYEDCEYVGYASSYPAKNKYLKKEWFSDSISVEFESNIYKAPIGWDDYLTTLYGDYMRLPPEDKRISHDIHAYKIND